jgi:VIT1/CCC1 family predicted Fe2+/Mn2+ transporter
VITRSLEKAKEAFQKRNAKASRAAHDANVAETAEHHTQEQGQYIKSLIYGGLDGIITTFAVVAGVAGADLAAGVDIMMVEELGLIEDDESPLKNALVTFFSFQVFGFVPLLAYVLARFIPALTSNLFLTAAILTGVTLFALGALKTNAIKSVFVSV